MDNDEASGDPVDRSQSSPTVGQILREARGERRLSLEQVAAELRIEPRWLDAMEHDRLTEVNPPVFAKGYLKQYGHLLGLDSAALIERYHAQVGPQETTVTPSRSIQLRDERQIALWVVAVVALVVLAGLLLFWWVSGADLEMPGAAEPAAVSAPEAVGVTRQGEPREDAAPTALETPVGDAGAAAAGGVTPPANAIGAAPEGAEALNAAAEAPAGATEPQSAAAADPSAAPADSAAADPSAAPADSAAAQADPETAEPAVDGLQLELIFDADSWTEANTADGERLFYGLGRAGEQSRFVVTGPVTVLLGNAEGVRVRIDGRPWPIPEEARQGNLARFTLRAPID